MAVRNENDCETTVSYRCIDDPEKRHRTAVKQYEAEIQRLSLRKRRHLSEDENRHLEKDDTERMLAVAQRSKAMHERCLALISHSSDKPV